MKTAEALSLVRGSTTIGSLPHHNVDAALACSFRTSIPFLPQIPIRNPWEYMIAQALEGLPGLQVDRDGTATINLDIWSSRSHAFQRRLDEAFAQAEKPEAFESFEPSPATSSCWQPFVWEVRERGAQVAKVQTAGPMTAQWALRQVSNSSSGANASHGGPQELPNELRMQIYRLVLARSLAMTRRIRAAGAQPVLFVDEPGLYGLNLKSPKHWQAFQELKLMLQTVRKSGVIVGLHCCSNTDWAAILGLGGLELDILSIDAHLSLKSLLTSEPEGRPEARSFADFVKAGGRLALGVIPTTKSSTLAAPSVRPAQQVAQLMAQVQDTFNRHSELQPAQIREILRSAIWTPACGLALHSVDAAEEALDSLIEFDRYASHTLVQGHA